VALWATCLALHGGTPVTDAAGVVYLRHRGGDTVLFWPVEEPVDALVRAAMSAPRECWGVA
jgi:hypothetical protein